MKNLLLVVLAITLGSTVGAQGVFSLGPKIGFNSNTITGNLESVNASIKNSLQIGAFVRAGSKVYFQPEINYQVVKGTLNQGSGSAFQSQDYTLKSIKVPALIGFKLFKTGIFNIRAMAGPAFTYFMDKKVDASIADNLWPIQSADDLKNSTWSVQMGAGFDVLFMTLDVRYEIGVNNMYDGSSSGFEMKNNIFNVSLGVKLL